MTGVHGEGGDGLIDNGDGNDGGGSGFVVVSIGGSGGGDGDDGPLSSTVTLPLTPRRPLNASLDLIPLPFPWQPLKLLHTRTQSVTLHHASIRAPLALTPL